MITTIVTILFRFIHSILTNPYIPTTCHYSPLNENPPITSWLFGLTLACASHLFITTTRVVYSKKISFVANIILTFIVTGNTISILFSWLDEENSMCSDFLGVELSPYLIFEWFVTVPAMFLLVPFYSIISMEKQWTAIQSAIMGGLAILMLFLGNIPMPYGVNVFFLLVSTTLIASALTWQLLFTWSLYQEAVSELALFPSKKRLSEACIKASVKVDVTFNQFSLAAVMILVFTIFPLLYYLRMTRFLDFDTFTISIFGVSFLAKFLYSHVLFEVNNAVLDYSLSNTLDEKQRLAESREILLRFVFHEIRVPLNSLTLGIQCLKEKAIAESQSDDAVETEVLDMMEEGAKFMTETLNDVLSFQKIEDGALMLEKTWFDPRKLLKTISATFKAQLMSKHIDLVREVDDTLPLLVYGDQFRLEHVLSNFVSNAIKFSSENSKVFVGISYKTHGPGLVTFYARDQGIGIAEEDQSKLFKVFSQIKPGELQKGNGSGLGLSICKNLVEMHEGEIGCKSTARNVPDDVITGGSEFYFSINHDEASALEFKNQKDPNATLFDQLKPQTVCGLVASESTGSLSSMPSDEIVLENIHIVEGSGHKVQVKSASTKVTAVSTKSIASLSSYPSESSKGVPHELTVVKNILIVDDSKSNCKLLKILLQQRGVLVCDACHDGTEAIELMLRSQSTRSLSYYDVVFMDSNMPKMNGQEAATLLRDAGYTNLLIGLTGDAMEEDVAIFEAAGADAVIAKPMKAITLDRLLQFGETYGIDSPFADGDTENRHRFKKFLFSR